MTETAAAAAGIAADASAAPPDGAGAAVPAARPVLWGCPCGAERELPPPGADPVPCAACGTPLVAPGKPGGHATERALGAALLVAVAVAAGWAAFSRFTGLGGVWFIAFGGFAAGWAARLAADARGLGIQRAALAAFVVFVLLGEHLQYRHALEARLIRMHAAEGTPDAVIEAESEMRRMDRMKYAAIEIDLAFWAAAIAGTLLAWRTPRRPDSVVGLRRGG